MLCGAIFKRKEKRKKCQQVIIIIITLEVTGFSIFYHTVENVTEII